MGEGAVKLDKKLYDAAMWILQHLGKMERGEHEGIELPAHSQEGRQGGAVLIFCPGAPEIYDLLEAFASGGIDERRYVIIPLHGLLEDKQQDLIFAPAPYGKRKVRRSMHQDCLLNPRNFVFYPFFTHFPPFFAHFQRLDARNPENTARSPGENGKKSIKIGLKGGN